MAMKRILNRTPKTLIITYGNGNKFIRLKKASVTTPLQENHPIFLEPSLGGMQQRGIISILTDKEYKEQSSTIRQQLQRQEIARKSMAQKLVDKDIKMRQIEEHNRKVEIQEKVAKLEAENVKGDASAETLVETEIEKKIDIEKEAVSTKREAPSVEELKLSSTVEDTTDQEFEDLKKAAATHIKAEEEEKKRAKKTRKRGKKKVESEEAPSTPSE